MKSERKRFLIGGLCGVAIMVLFAFYHESVAGQLRGQYHFPIFAKN